jgi:7-cyano-7-deazaguanine synthase in queuosine biosynthesis
MTRPFTVVVNDCETPPLHNIRHVRTRNTEYGEANYHVVFDRLVNGLPERLTPRQLDWLETLTAIFAADMICDRGEGDLDWGRSIDLFVPVRDPEFSQSLASQLQDVFGNLTDDRLALHFVQESQPTDPPRTRANRFPATRGVALLSGGMDSFVGALQLLNETEDDPYLFVSHSTSGAARASQDRLRPVLRGLSAASEFPLFTAEKRHNFPTSEGSQRSRSLLYVGAAATAAAAMGTEDVYLNENGVLAIHLPMSEARIGSYSTRTASPQLLDDMSALASAALERQIRVRNVLLPMTKPEVARLGADLGQADVLPETTSCWSAGRTREHCGYCAPCIMRRISCELHGLADVDYRNDPFGDEVFLAQNLRATDNMVHLGGLVRDFRELNDFELELEYVEIFSGGTQMSAGEALALHHRWAEQAAEVLSRYEVGSRYI